MCAAPEEMNLRESRVPHPAREHMLARNAQMIWRMEPMPSRAKNAQTDTCGVGESNPHHATYSSMESITFHHIEAPTATPSYCFRVWLAPHYLPAHVHRPCKKCPIAATDIQ